jgi:acyl-coenzyme A thioesterase 13
VSSRPIPLSQVSFSKQNQSSTKFIHFLWTRYPDQDFLIRPQVTFTPLELPVYTMSPIPSNEELKQRTQAWLSAVSPDRSDSNTFDRAILDTLNLTSVTYDASSKTTKSIFSFTMTPFLANRMGSLHGGAAATIFDIVTSSTVLPAAIVFDAERGISSDSDDSSPWLISHVSRTLNVTYLRPAPIGTELEVESEVISLGKQLAMIRGTIRRRADGVPCSMCEHGKVVFKMGARL